MRKQIVNWCFGRQQFSQEADPYPGEYSGFLFFRGAANKNHSDDDDDDEEAEDDDDAEEDDDNDDDDDEEDDDNDDDDDEKDEIGKEKQRLLVATNCFLPRRREGRLGVATTGDEWRCQ